MTNDERIAALVDNLKRAMEDDMGEPLTPEAKAQYDVEMATRDAWIASAELYKLRSDPIASKFFTSKVEGDLWAIKTRVDLIISELRAENGERPIPKLSVV